MTGAAGENEWEAAGESGAGASRKMSGRRARKWAGGVRENEGAEAGMKGRRWRK
jgi:hypothetical protein